MNRPDVNSLNKEQLKYVEYLESCLNGTPDLILEMNNLNSILAKDLHMICQGKDTEDVKDEESGEVRKKSNLILLGSDKDDKTFDKITKLITLYEKLKLIGLTPKEEIKKRTKLKLEVGDNAFEKVISDVKSRTNGHKTW